jgi:hypothetical protein
MILKGQLYQSKGKKYRKVASIKQVTFQGIQISVIPLVNCVKK